MKKKNRRYKVTIEFQVKTETVAKGIELIKKAMRSMRLKVIKVEPLRTLRSNNQNNALHLWLYQITTEAEHRGLTLDMWLKKPAEMKITESMLKDCFREMGRVMYNKKSTAKLDKYEFSELVFLFDKMILERLGIDIEFPNIDLLLRKEDNN
jgi:hypothetical protein